MKRRKSKHQQQDTLASAPSVATRTKAHDLAVPIPPARYTPTTREDAIIQKARARLDASKPPVRFELTQRSASDVTLSVKHESQAMGQVLTGEILGTANEIFTELVVTQLMELATVSGEVSSLLFNRLFAMVQGIGPRDETEALLAVQMVAIHNATLQAARSFTKATMLPQYDSYANAMNKLARTFAVQVETLKRYRSNGEQRIRVQHVTVNDGGQAVVASGDVQVRGGVNTEIKGQPHGPAESGERSTPMLGNVKALQAEVQSPGNEGLESVPMPRRPGRSAQG